MSAAETRIKATLQVTQGRVALPPYVVAVLGDYGNGGWVSLYGITPSILREVADRLDEAQAQHEADEYERRVAS